MKTLIRQEVSCPQDIWSLGEDLELLASPVKVGATRIPVWIEHATVLIKSSCGRDNRLKVKNFVDLNVKVIPHTSINIIETVVVVRPPLTLLGCTHCRLRTRCRR